MDCSRLVWPAIALLACEASSSGPPGDAANEPAVTEQLDGAEAESDSFRAVVEIFARSCAYQRCHAPPILGGGLSFAKDVDFHAQLVGVTACEYERMKRVEPGDPERSWLMVKLTAEARKLGEPYPTFIYFDPPPDWDPNERGCRSQTSDGAPLFGQRMPATAPNMLPPEEIETIRRWIEDGAPR